MISKDIREKVKKAIGKYTHRQIAKMYNVGVGTVSAIRNEGKAPEIKRLKNDKTT
jgi:transposase